MLVMLVSRTELFCLPPFLVVCLVHLLNLLSEKKIKKQLNNEFRILCKTKIIPCTCFYALKKFSLVFIVFSSLIYL